MARISDEEIIKLKQSVSLVRLVEQSGITLKTHGKDRIGHCPFHNDKTPSLIVSPEKNLWHCLGACNMGGSNIDWLMKFQGISYKQALDILRSDIPSLAALHARRAELLPFLDNVAQADQQLRHRVIDFYHTTLKASPDALSYLTARGLGSQELIDHFNLGYANRTLNHRLPEKTKKAGKAMRARLQSMGLLRDTGHEHLSGCLIVPIVDHDNNVVEVYGRRLGHRLPKGTAQHLYLPGPHAGVWNAKGLVDQDEVILCEALIDAMTFWVNGYKHVTASYGTGGFTEGHLSVFKELGIKRVLIAYDSDEAGNNAAEGLANKLGQEGLDCFRIQFPSGMDANAYALQVQPADKSLGVVIRAAAWMGNGKPPERQLTIELAEQDAVVPIPSLAADGPAASPKAKAEQSDMVEPEISAHEVIIPLGDRRYRVRGLEKNNSYEVMKVNVLVSCGDALHVDTIDVYSAKQRQAFARVAAGELRVEDKVIQKDLGQLLLQLENLQEKAIQDALKSEPPATYTMDASEKDAALELLQDPHLADRIVADFIKTGLVGEPTNALMGYLAAVSRKLTSPLAIIVQSTSAAGKSALMDAVLRLVPEEDQVNYSAMTGQSLFYVDEGDLKHKILAIAEEEGVKQAAYALKLLQSQGELSIASTSKDPKTGKLVTEEYHVEGPVMLFLTTTAIDIDEELLNRCVVLTIDESRAQTDAIQTRQRQRRTLSGLQVDHESDLILQQHQNAQRLLQPLAIVNPYAEQLTFANNRTRTRRDHEKYLTLIDSIALLHQHQRPTKRIEQRGQVIEYVEVTTEDIALANQLAHEVLGRSLDELPPPTRRLLNSIHALVQRRIDECGMQRSEIRFTRRDIREAAGLSDKQVRVHLERLVELDYVYAHSGRTGQRFVYELVFDGQVESNYAQLIGLIDVDQLKNVSPLTNLVVSNGNLVA